MATTRMIKSKQERIPIKGLWVLLVLAIAGIAAWIYQLIDGMQVTGLGQQVVWGLYIAAFFTAAGAGAGLLALIGLNEFRPMIPSNRRTNMLWLALTTFVVAAILILMDIGNPLRAWRILTAFKFSAMMTWDFWALILAGLVTLAYLVFSTPVKPSSKPQRGLGVIAILVALALVVIEGLMLTELAARPLWGGITLASFLIGALIAGLALLFLITPIKEVSSLKIWMAIALVSNLVLVFSEVASGLFTGEPRIAEDIRNLLFGTTSPFFWLHVIVGLILPLWLLSKTPLKQKGLIASTALFGVVAEKTWVLAAGQNQSWLTLPQGDYLPSWVEFLAVIGIVALGILTYQLIENFLIQGRKEVKAEEEG